MTDRGSVRDASTVALLRDGRDGLEVFLMRRPTTMAFAAGMYVFPGGAVEESDLAVPVAPGADLAMLGRRASTAAPRALLAAAVRETYEECGVLVAADPRGRSGPTHRPTDRAALMASQIDLADLLALRGLVLDPDLLPLFAHWVTPQGEWRRFNTRFFVAALPEGQVADADGEEADGSGWWRPDDAIDGYERGELALMTPTISVLAWLATQTATTDALDRARRLEVRPLLPQFELDDAGELVGWSVTDAVTGEPLDVHTYPVPAAGLSRGAFRRPPRLR